MNKNVNDDKFNEYQKNRIFKYVIIILSILVIVLEILALLQKVNMIWGVIIFIIIYFLKKFILKWLILEYFFGIISIY